MPRVHVVLRLGLPDPDRLSTTLLWSVLGHSGLLLGVLIYQSLPSSATIREPSYFVKLVAPAGEPGRGGASAPTAAPVRPAVPIEKPPIESASAPPPRPAPAKTSVPPAAVKKSAPRSEKAPPAAAPSAATATEPGTSQGEEGAPGRGAATGPGSASSGSGPGAGGVGGTSFGEGFQSDWYRNAIESKLRTVWRRPLGSSQATESAIVAFTIRRNGALEDVAIQTPSGNDILDLSVVRAVYDAAPLPPLPRSWPNDTVRVRMEFELTTAAR